MSGVLPVPVAHGAAAPAPSLGADAVSGLPDGAVGRRARLLHALPAACAGPGGRCAEGGGGMTQACPSCGIVMVHGTSTRPTRGCCRACFFRAYRRGLSTLPLPLPRRWAGCPACGRSAARVRHHGRGLCSACWSAWHRQGRPDLTTWRHPVQQRVLRRPIRGWRVREQGV